MWISTIKNDGLTEYFGNYFIRVNCMFKAVVTIFILNNFSRKSSEHNGMKYWNWSAFIPDYCFVFKIDSIRIKYFVWIIVNTFQPSHKLEIVFKKILKKRDYSVVLLRKYEMWSFKIIFNKVLNDVFKHLHISHDITWRMSLYLCHKEAKIDFW